MILQYLRLLEEANGTSTTASILVMIERLNPNQLLWLEEAMAILLL